MLQFGLKIECAIGIKAYWGTRQIWRKLEKAGSLPSDERVEVRAVDGDQLSIYWRRHGSPQKESEGRARREK